MFAIILFVLDISLHETQISCRERTAWQWQNIQSSHWSAMRSEWSIVLGESCPTFIKLCPSVSPVYLVLSVSAPRGCWCLCWPSSSPPSLARVPHGDSQAGSFCTCSEYFQIFSRPKYFHLLSVIISPSLSRLALSLSSSPARLLKMMSDSRPSGVGPPGKYRLRITESKLEEAGLQVNVLARQTEWGPLIGRGLSRYCALIGWNYNDTARHQKQPSNHGPHLGSRESSFVLVVAITIVISERVRTFLD